MGHRIAFTTVEIAKHRVYDQLVITLGLSLH